MGPGAAAGFKGSHTNLDAALEAGEGEAAPSGEGTLVVATGSSGGVAWPGESSGCWACDMQGHRTSSHSAHVGSRASPASTLVPLVLRNGGGPGCLRVWPPAPRSGKVHARGPSALALSEDICTAPRAGVRVWCRQGLTGHPLAPMGGPHVNWQDRTHRAPEVSPLSPCKISLGLHSLAWGYGAVITLCSPWSTLQRR